MCNVSFRNFLTCKSCLTTKWILKFTRMGDAELDAHTVLVTRQPEARFTRNTRSEFRRCWATCSISCAAWNCLPPHKDNSPTAVVWVVPEIIQPKFKENIFHQLNDFLVRPGFRRQRGSLGLVAEPGVPTHARTRATSRQRVIAPRCHPGS